MIPAGFGHNGGPPLDDISAAGAKSEADPRGLTRPSGRACSAARVDQAGLLWLLGARELVALTSSSAAIETAAGGVQTHCRTRARSAAQWLPWQRNMVDHKVAP
jgi:hypothetical protein